MKASGIFALTFLGGVLASTAGKGGKTITIPPRATDTSLKSIPDAAHPFKAPGSNDMRGPCPALNTMANHGYIPRNGIVSLDDIVAGGQEAFNVERDLLAALGSFGMLARGNAYLNLLSIGGPSPLVPPLPGNLDGPVARGLATHGRFEGDVSMTREDFAIGDNVHFQNSLFDQLLLNVGQFGDDSPVTGNRSIVTPLVMQHFKFERFVNDQIANKELEYHIGRFTLSYGESAFTLKIFANGTDGILTVPTMGSFFRNQTFPANWHRSAKPVDINTIGETVGTIFGDTPIVPGANDAQGRYVPDNITDDCPFYDSIVRDSLPAVLVTNTTGILKQNVETLLGAMTLILKGDDNCTIVQPSGPADT